MTLEEYAKKILTDAGCDEYTYWGKLGEHLMDDLKEAFPDGMEYPYVDVANAILAMSRPKPIVRAPYRMCIDTQHVCDGFDCTDEEEAREAALDSYCEWMAEFWDDHDVRHIDEETVDEWYGMVMNNFAYIGVYNPETDEYDEECLTDEEEDRIGWRVFETVEEMREFFKEAMG